MLEKVLAGESKIPVFVLTGFLGSGKTTLLNRLLTSGGLQNTAILVNEFSDLGIDQLLIRQVSEQVVLLNSGCVCCSVREDLLQALRELFIDGLRDQASVCERVLIETSGISDPMPVIHTLLTDPFLRDRYCLGGVVTTVDACQSWQALCDRQESLHQLVVADRLIMTKRDLASSEMVATLTDALQGMNPDIPIHDNGLDHTADLGRWMMHGGSGAHDEALLLGRLRANTPSGLTAFGDGVLATRPLGPHRAPVHAFVVRAREPLEWQELMEWIEQLLGRTPQNVLRLKGVVELVGQARPAIIQGVRHVFHPVTWLPDWPQADRSSRLVVIVDNPDRLSRDGLRQEVFPRAGSLSEKLSIEKGAV